jgi:two-component sensor histidine kinase
VLSRSAALTKDRQHPFRAGLHAPHRLALEATEFKTEIEMNTIRLKRPKADRRVGTARKVAEGLDTHPNSDVPSIAPRCIHDLCTETIPLSEQLLDEWNHRLKNNLQILVGLLESGYRKARNSEAREVLSDAIRRIGAIGTAQQVYHSARGSTDVSGQDLVNAVCANARILFGSDVSIDWKTARGDLPKEAAMPLALIINELLTNAAKYGGNQHGQVTITVGLSRRPGLYEICVQDEGLGFDLEHPSSRLSGLGLVKALAQRLGGTFSVERRPGARCTVRFPDQ